MRAKPTRKAAAPEQAERPKVITLTVLPSVIEKIDQIAVAERRTRTQQLNVWIDRAVEEWERSRRGRRTA
jgi:hypothetical protein